MIAGGAKHRKVQKKHKYNPGRKTWRASPGLRTKERKMNILNIAAPSTLPHPGEHAPVERFATVVISPRIQVQGVLIWQEGAHACVETSPDRQFTGRVANMA